MKKKKEEPMHVKSLLAMAAGLIMASSCNPTKYVADNEKRYTGGEVTIHNDTLQKDRKEAFERFLEESLLPKPPSKFLGMYCKVGLWNMGGGPDTTKTGFFNRWLRKQGEEPVLLSEVNSEYNEKLWRNKMDNLGFFNALVTSVTFIEVNKSSG